MQFFAINLQKQHRNNSELSFLEVSYALHRARLVTCCDGREGVGDSRDGVGQWANEKPKEELVSHFCFIS